MHTGAAEALRKLIKGMRLAQDATRRLGGGSSDMVVGWSGAMIGEDAGWQADPDAGWRRSWPGSRTRRAADAPALRPP